MLVAGLFFKFFLQKNNAGKSQGVWGCQAFQLAPYFILLYLCLSFLDVLLVSFPSFSSYSKVITVPDIFLLVNLNQ